jgi:hypothetical protein
MKMFLGVLVLMVGLSFGGVFTPQIGVSFPIQMGEGMSSFDGEASPIVAISLEEKVSSYVGCVVGVGYIPNPDGIATFDEFIIPISFGLRGHMDNMFIAGGGVGLSIFDTKEEDQSDYATPIMTGYVETGIISSGLEWVCRFEAVDGDAHLYSLFGFPL